MRIIAGEARGRRLTVPPGHDIRPTPDRVREALFSTLSPRLGRAAFLDLFAGSGANGIEALSRGADRVVLVEKDRNALAAIRQNVAASRLQGDIQCVQATLPEGLTLLRGPFDLIFADPPYAFEQYMELLAAIASLSLLATGGLCCVEHAHTRVLPAQAETLTRIRERRYGKTVIATYAHNPERQPEIEA